MEVYYSDVECVKDEMVTASKNDDDHHLVPMALVVALLLHDVMLIA